jgi:hypothetical protein
MQPHHRPWHKRAIASPLIFSKYLAKQMSQDYIAISLTKCIVINLTRRFGISPQPRQILEGVDSILTTSAVSSPFNKVDNVHMSLPYSLSVE